ncbi:MAG: hypothetical protein H0X04_00460 [Chthoniobacterales bacterium]|nr:hypothetical protein [Chthoniobacterales bacterium]
MFEGKQVIRCVCGKPFGEVAPNVRVQLRERPEYRAVSERHITHRCRDCRKELDLLIEVAA